MEELGLNIMDVAPWFQADEDSPYVLVRVSSEHAAEWSSTLAEAIRRCYICDDVLKERAEVLEEELGGTMESRQTSVIGAKLPDPGSTMAGDFGEIITYLYQAASVHPQKAFGPKKWKLKQDRTKPAPFSDVIHFILPTWPEASEEDQLLCAEVKTKSTSGNSSPIPAAIEDSGKDRTSRLAKTLVWLRDRAMTESLGQTMIAHLDRFINATDHPSATRHFSAVAVICSNLVDAELIDAPDEESDNYTLVVVAVPDLKDTYESSFASAKVSTAT